ncbi:MAG: toxin-antitoxin system HicB family antitoxin [[Eubacterium] rectale]|nr:toxin-antitoxin system HicB family antitoxin [Agathobacter rectalis]
MLICKQGKVPKLAYKGSFKVRISSELHKKIVILFQTCT